MSVLSRTLVVAAALVLTAGCGEADGSGPGGPAEVEMADLAERGFDSVSVTDGAQRPLRPGTTVTLSFDDDEVHGSAGCNSLGSTASVDGGRLVVQGLGGTEMGCGGRQYHDEWLSDLLTSRPEITLDGDRLTLSSGGTVVQLQDRESARPDVALVGTRWTLQMIESGIGPDATASSVPAGVRSTLVLGDDGTLTVRPGCNSGSAGYRVEGDTIRAEPLVLTRRSCGEPAKQVEAAMLAVFEGDVTHSVDGSELRLQGAEQALVYRAG
jgi:heat shock protein HslJ